MRFGIVHDGSAEAGGAALSMLTIKAAQRTVDTPDAKFTRNHLPRGPEVVINLMFTSKFERGWPGNP